MNKNNSQMQQHNNIVPTTTTTTITTSTSTTTTATATATATATIEDTYQNNSETISEKRLREDNEKELALILQAIAIMKSAMILELLGFNIDQYREFLSANIDKTEDLTSMFIELKIIYYNTKIKKIHRKELSVNVKIPKFLMRHLFEKSYLVNTNKYRDMVATINQAINITVINEEYQKKYQELIGKRKAMTLLESDDMEFVTNIGHNKIMDFCDQIIKKK